MLGHVVGDVATFYSDVAICGGVAMISYYVAMWAPTAVFTLFFGWRGFVCGVVCVVSAQGLAHSRETGEKCK